MHAGDRGAMSSAPPPLNLRQRAEALFRARFVGRAGELGRLRRLLPEADGEPRLVWLVGPAGVGKTTLAWRAALDWREAGRRVVWVDCEQSDPSDALSDAVRAAAAEQGLAPGELGCGPQADVLVVDALEALPDGERRLLGGTLPDLGERLLVVVTSRERPALAVRLDLVWGALLREESIAALPLDEAVDLLAAVGLDRARGRTLARAAGGHPLTLTLLAREAARGDAPGAALPADVLVERVVEQFVSGIADPLHRRALYVSSMTRVLDPALLRHALESDDADAAYAWLEGLEQVRRTPGGLMLHDSLRTLLARQLQRDHPDLRAVLLRRMVEHRMADLDALTPPEQYRAFMDCVYAGRASPMLASFDSLGEMARLGLAPAAGDRVDQMAAIAAAHEGEASAALLRATLAGQPGWAVVDAARQVQGMVVVVDALDAPAEDPLWSAAAEVARRLSVEQGSGRAALYRWFCARDGYQAFSAAMMAVVTAGPCCVPTPERYSYLLFYVEDPERWHTLSGSTGLIPIPGAELALGGRRYGAFWRPQPKSLRPQVTAAVLTLGGVQPAAPVATAAAAPAERVVRDALRALHRRPELGGSPLRELALVRALAARPMAPADAVRAALEAARAELARSPDHREDAELLRLTYFEPGTTQEAAAEALALPYGTYRYRLRRAVALLAAELRGLEAEAIRQSFDSR